MKLFLLFLIVPFFFSAQEIRKENLSKKKRYYFDAKQDKLESEGCYYSTENGRTIALKVLYKKNALISVGNFLDL